MERLNLSRLQADEISAHAAACVSGAPPPCARECPFGLDVRSFISKAEKGRWQAAYKTYRDAVVFPEIVSRLCPAPCSGACARTDAGGAIDLGGLERAVVSLTRDKRRDGYAIPQKSGTAAVVGAGPSGLSAALSLALKRYDVTVFERESSWGGSLRSHAEFGAFDAEFSQSFASLGAEFQFGREISSLAELSGFGAIYLATGSGGEAFGLLAGLDLESLATSDPRVFLGGGLTGAELMDAIAHGRAAARSLESFFQIGKAPPAARAPVCSWTPDTSEIEAAPRVAPADPSGAFTDIEARAEAARCLKCDCDVCLQGCEMLRRFHKLPMKIASEVFTDIHANPPYSSHTLTREAYSCSDCGHCKRRCPESIDVGELLRLSRRARVESGAAPPALHDYWLREMRFSSDGAAFYSACNEKGSCEYVFFPGCQLGAYDPRHVSLSLAALRKNYDAGVFLGCCGAPAYWAGDDAALEENSALIRRAWSELGEPVFVLACMTCEKLFSDLFPEIECVSLYEMLAAMDCEQAACNLNCAPTARPTADLPRNGNLECDTRLHNALPEADPAVREAYMESTRASPVRAPGRSLYFQSAAIFDPCSAAEDERVRESVRALASRSGVALSELSESGKCCGYGGNIRLANPSLYEEIGSNRAAASELPYIVYCANCRAVFAARDKQCAHILDIAFGLAPAEIPDIDTRRRNSLEVKRLISQEFSSGSAVFPKAEPWEDISLIIAPDVAERVDRKLISLSDIREALYLARESGAYFEASDGTRQCSMARPALVYWVRYRLSPGGTYEVLDAYYHRMKFEGA
ncbi:MAG: NAD(P)-binding protein [Oscillospiraceae bacterium]|jgi:NADPH-dependent glutamate synthase beta subunit-like oxidoreductase|nr:NAD(P)-binding protein [Oscillospiraceae bacterium]